MRGHLRGEGGVPVLAGRMRPDRLDERRQPEALGAGHTTGTGPVRTDGHDLRAVRRVGAGLEQRLQVGAPARDEDDEALDLPPRRPDPSRSETIAG